MSHAPIRHDINIQAHRTRFFSCQCPHSPDLPSLDGVELRTMPIPRLLPAWQRLQGFGGDPTELHYGGLNHGELNYGGLNYGGLNYGGLNYGDIVSSKPILGRSAALSFSLGMAVGVAVPIALILAWSRHKTKTGIWPWACARLAP